MQPEDFQYVADIFLPAKPVFYVCNVDEKSIITGNKHVDAVQEKVKDEKAEVLVIAAAIETE